MRLLGDRADGAIIVNDPSASNKVSAAQRWPYVPDAMTIVLAIGKAVLVSTRRARTAL